MKKSAPLLLSFAGLCAMTVAARAAEVSLDDSLLSGPWGAKWVVGQLFTVLASAFGIYFASYVSFQRSLKHSKLVKAQQVSGLLTATRQELSENILRMRKLDERLPADSGYGLSDAEWPSLRLYVWHAAGRSNTAFDLPPQVLNGVQGFYEDIDAMLKDSAARENFRRLTTSNTYDRTQYKERFNALLSGAETEILAVLDKTVAEARATVAKLGG
jgi:hypothetical protein